MTAEAQARSSAVRTATITGLAAALLDLGGSWHVSIWSDEVATVSAATRTPADLLRLVDQLDAVHATYYAFMHLWVSAFGTTLVSIRTPSALAVGLAVSGTYLLGRRLADHGTGLVAALALAVLPRSTWAGIEARSFAFTIACAVWLTLALLVAVQARRRLAWVVYGAVLALGIGINLYLVLMAGAHLVTLLSRKETRANVRTLAAVTAASLALTSPLVLTALGQGGQLGERTFGTMALARNVLVNQWFLGETPTPTTAIGSGLESGGLWKLASVALAAICWWFVLRALVSRFRTPVGADRDLVAWAVPWLAVPTVAVLAYAVVSPNAYNARYLTYCAPAVALLVAAGLRASPARLAMPAAAVAVALVAPIYLSQRSLTAKSGSDLSLVAAYLDGRVRPGDAVYFGPRDDARQGEVLRSLRTVALAYPEVFRGSHDVTLLASPAAGATLFGTSAPLAEMTGRLAGATTLWVVRREDRPAESRADDTLLAGLGFREDARWRGPMTEVLELSRG